MACLENTVCMLGIWCMLGDGEVRDVVILVRNEGLITLLAVLFVV